MPQFPPMAVVTPILLSLIHISLAVVHEAVAGQHDVGVEEGHVHVLRLHHMADGDGAGGLPAKRPENGLRAAMPFVGALADLDDGIIRLIPLQETSS